MLHHRVDFVVNRLDKRRVRCDGLRVYLPNLPRNRISTNPVAVPCRGLSITVDLSRRHELIECPDHYDAYPFARLRHRIVLQLDVCVRRG